jgi:S-adenosylmethionine:tRNA ribosyltransferase-isomerase
MLRTSDLDYQLPDELIATRPEEPRDSARLLVIDRDEPSRAEATIVRDLPSFLREGDLLIFNDSRVLPARLSGVRRSTGGRIGGLFLYEHAPGRWEALLRSNGRLRAGDVIDLEDAHGERTTVSMTLLERADEGWLAEVRDESRPSHEPAGVVLGRIGATPLPPYILFARRQRHESIPDEEDRDWYQTVYADATHTGSVAAPTAGLHFTPSLLKWLGDAGVGMARVTLHVGAGTFKPIEVDTVEDHPIHAEWAETPSATLDAVRETRARGGRVVCVGTTSARALESAPESAADGWLGETRLLITPGYRWKRLDGLLTNLHLPRSTLLAMVGALFPRGVDNLRPLYERAVRDRFRFYSYGDAMLILPDAFGRQNER